MIRSQDYLETRLRLEQARRHHRHQARGDVVPRPGSFDHLEDLRLDERIATLEREFASIGPTLDFVLAGRGVHGHRIEVGELVGFVRPLGVALRNTSRDLMLRDGDDVAPQDRRSLAEPVVTEIFDGSFGIKVGQAPSHENLSLLRAPLFDRTADKFVSVLRVARDADDPQAVITELWDLRERAINGYRGFAERLQDGTSTAQVRWKGDVVTIRPPHAELLFRAVSEVEEEEEIREITGTLTGGDVSDQRFHLVATDPETNQRMDYRGSVADALLPTVRLIRFDSRVVATVAFILTFSPLIEEPKVSYELRNLRILEDNG